MIAVWIFAILFTLIILKYAFLLFKRWRLIRKIKKQSDDIRFCRNRFRSVFLPDGKPDLEIRKGEKTYLISVITTPFQRMRYHYCNPKKMEVYLVNKGYFLINFRRGPMVSLERAFKIKSYKIKFDFQSEFPHYVIPNPAPPIVTKVQGSEIQVLGNNDFLYGETRICGLKYFLEEVIPNIKKDA